MVTRIPLTRGHVALVDDADVDALLGDRIMRDEREDREQAS